MTSRNEKELISIVSSNTVVEISSSVVGEFVDYIGRNLSPGDVFSTSDLENWAESNGYIKE